MKFRNHYFIILLLLHSCLQGQSLSRVLEAAEKSMSTKNYFDAYSKFNEALEFEPTNPEYLYKAAESARLLGAYKVSATLYDSLLSNENNNLFPLTSFWLGKTRQIQGDYNNAIRSFKIFTTEYSGPDTNLINIALKEIQACEWAIEQLKHPSTGVTLNKLSESINSSFSDFAPSFWKNKFIYSSLRFENTKDIYIPKRYLSSLLVSENENVATKLLSEDYIPKGLNIAHSSFNKDVSKVYFTICEDLNDYDKRCDLYLASVDPEGRWSNYTKLPDNINQTGYTSTQPHYCLFGKDSLETLFFVSDRPGGLGKLDIWYSILDGNGNYSEPQNCRGINTNMDDVTPFYYERSNSLYYSSQGQLGMGGFDIYYSQYLDDHWDTPKNMGVPINSSFDDVYFTITIFDTIGYLASNRTGSQFLDDVSEACCLDLFKVKLQACDINLEALTYNFYSQKELYNVTVRLYDLDRPQSEPIIITHELNNKYNFNILCDKNYKIVANKIGFFPDSILLYTGKPTEFTKISKRLFLKPDNVRLDVLTYYEKTGAPLNEVTVKLYDLDNPSLLPVEITNFNTNLSQFEIIPCHTYKISGAKPKYGPAELKFTVDCNLSGPLIQKLYLTDTIFSLLPLNLYFDNDRPNPGTLSLKTKLTYAQTYKNYYFKKAEYIDKFNKINSNKTDSINNAMFVFFEKEVKDNFNQFNNFMEVLKSDLANGKKYEIFVKGYASPLAKPDYNLNLSQRRIQSIYNEFYKFGKGVFLKYLKNGQLKLSQKPFGENTAPMGISDIKKDLRSVYTVEASKERRVEIVEIK